MSGKIVFIIGGARSGKSSFALNLANNYILSKKGVRKAYIATAEALDDEMKAKIEEHRRNRGDDWDTYEEPLKISDVLSRIKGKYSVIVIDCLTLWLSNLMHSNKEIENEIQSFCSSLFTVHCSLFIVSNEVGLGIVPDNALSRKFRDMSGYLNQRVAEIADKVYLLTAGIPIKIK